MRYLMGKKGVDFPWQITLYFIGPRLIILLQGNLLFPMCQMSKKCCTAGFPRSWHFLGQSSLIHFAIEVCRSEISNFIIISVPSKKVNAFSKAKNCIAELLPAWLAWKQWNGRKWILEFWLKEKERICVLQKIFILPHFPCSTEGLGNSWGRVRIEGLQDKRPAAGLGRGGCVKMTFNHLIKPLERFPFS